MAYRRTAVVALGGTSHLSTNNGIFQCDLRNGISPFDWYIGADKIISGSYSNSQIIRDYTNSGADITSTSHYRYSDADKSIVPRNNSGVLCALFRLR